MTSLVQSTIKDVEAYLRASDIFILMLHLCQNLFYKVFLHFSSLISRNFFFSTILVSIATKGLSCFIPIDKGRVSKFVVEIECYLFI